MVAASMGPANCITSIGQPAVLPGPLSQACFVDQAPLQNVAADWKWGSTGCYDVASLTRLQCKLQSGGHDYSERVAGCLGQGGAGCCGIGIASLTHLRCNAEVRCGGSVQLCGWHGVPQHGPPTTSGTRARSQINTVQHTFVRYVQASPLSQLSVRSTTLCMPFTTTRFPPFSHRVHAYSPPPLLQTSPALPRRTAASAQPSRWQPK